MTASKQPYIKWWTSDFLNGVIDLTPEQIGVYTVLITLMADKGAPISSDSAWLARRCGTNTRAFNRILASLIEIGKIEEHDGVLGNHRMMGEVIARQKERSNKTAGAKARWKKWAEGNPISLPFDDPDSTNCESNGESFAVKPAEKQKINRQLKINKSQKTANQDANLHNSPSRRARARPELELESTHPIPTPLIDARAISDDDDGSGSGEDKLDRLSDADLQDLYQAVANASGHNPSSPAQIDRAFKFVEKWKAAGVDFDKVVIPTIRAMISESSEPSRTLGRFDARIFHEHARVAATPSNRAYQPPAEPILAPEGETETFRPLRDALLKKMGPAAYSTFLNHVRFEEVDGVPGKDRRVMRVSYVRKGSIILMDGNRVGLVTREAQAIGFTEVW